MNRTTLILLVAAGGFILLILYMKRQQTVYRSGFAAGTIAVPPPSNTASSIDYVLSGVAQSLPSILGGFKNLFSNPSNTGVAGSNVRLGYGSNVPDSNTGAGPDEGYSGFNVDYNTLELQDSAYDPSYSMDNNFGTFDAGGDSEFEYA